MKEENLTQLIEKAKEEMILFGYSETSIREYNIIFNEILTYFDNIKVDTFNYDVILQYFIRKYNIESFHKTRLKKYQLKHFRACKILDDIAKNESIKRQYNYTVQNKITNSFYQDTFNTFLNYIEKIGLSRNIRMGIKRVTNNFLLYLSNLKIEKIEEINFNVVLSFIEKFPENRKSKNLYLYYLRTFLDYLYNENLINHNLSTNIPNLKLVKNNTIPSIWDFKDVKLLLDSIDKTTPKGIRNYAIILLAITTSMRGCDIINLKIQNIDFKNNVINFVQEKTKKAVELPLLSSTKDAIANYLLNARPKSNYDNVFLTLNSIPKPLENTSTLTCMIDNYVKNLNLNTNQKRGIHSFRHTVLNCLYNDNETSLTTITEISGHNNPESLHSYIKTDINRLRDFTLNMKDFEVNNGQTRI